MKYGFAVAFLCLAAGCATAPTDIKFGEQLSTQLQSASVISQSDDSIVLLAIGPIGTAGSYQFQKLNESQTDFEGEPVLLGFAAWGVGDKMKRPETEKSSLWVLDQQEINFLIKKIPAGKYAATYAAWNIASPVTTGSAWNCLTDGAFIYDIAPGKINIVSSREAFPLGTVSRLASGIADVDILAQFERTRTNYPDLKGDAELIDAIGEARWTEAKGGLFSAECRSVVDGSLSVSRVMTSEGEAEKDEAERAAIEAAIANLKESETKTLQMGETK